MKLEDLKIGTKIKFTSPDKCEDLKNRIESANEYSPLWCYTKANIIFEVIEITEIRILTKIIDWDKSMYTLTYLTNLSAQTIPLCDCHLFEEYNIEDHSGMVYNPYSNSWSFL